MVANLIDNTVIHSEQDSFIDVTTEVDGPTARLIVESGGPVLDSDKIGKLARPFRRLGAERTGSVNGTGLGLSIVAAIAAAHRGTLDLQPRPEGGLRVVIELPHAAPPSPTGTRREGARGRRRSAPRRRHHPRAFETKPWPSTSPTTVWTPPPNWR